MTNIYRQAMVDFLNGLHDWDDGALDYRIVLVKPGYTFDASHNFLTDVTGGGYELNQGNGNTNGYHAGFGNAGRKALSSRSVVNDSTNNRASARAANQTWTALAAGAGTVGGAVVVYVPSGASSDSTVKMLAFIDFPDDTPNGADWTLSLPNTELFYIG